MNWTKKLLSSVSLIVLIAVVVRNFNCFLHWQGTTLQAGIFSCILIGCTVVILDIALCDISSHHTMKSLVEHYLAIRAMTLLGYFMSRSLEKSTKTCKETQEKILLKRLGNNKDTEYGKRFSFSSIRSAEEFVKCHPLTRYSHYKSYVERLGKGEKRLLTEESPMMLAVTSGTSGTSSTLPFTKQQSGYFFLQGITVLYYHMLKAYPHLNSLRKNLKFFYTPRWQKSEAGIPVGPNSSSPTNSKQILSLYTTPLPGFDILDEREALYIHLLFGLKEDKLGMIEANFASIVHTAFTFLEQEWENLVSDIERGEVNPQLNISEDVRKRLNALLTPDPERATQLRKEFRNGFDNIAKRIWPTCDLVLCADTGTFELYGDILKQTYCHGIPMYSPLYAASEGLIGVNIWPLSDSSEYLLVPSSMFCEFIPVENTEEDQPSTLLMHQVKVDCDYELVITNVSGLYRYRFGDVIRVKRFHNDCPVVEFLYRQGQLLNVRGEKTSENSFYQALCDAVNEWPGVSLVDYCCVESALTDTGSQSMPYYVLFVEVTSDETVTLTDTQKELVDSKLRRSFVYDSFRKKDSIAPMVVHTVRKGSFIELREFMIQTTSASANQYKVPRVLRRKEAYQFMMDRVI